MEAGTGIQRWKGNENLHLEVCVRAWGKERVDMVGETERPGQVLTVPALQHSQSDWSGDIVEQCWD